MDKLFKALKEIELYSCNGWSSSACYGRFGFYIDSLIYEDPNFNQIILKKVKYDKGKSEITFKIISK